LWRIARLCRIGIRESRIFHAAFEQGLQGWIGLEQILVEKCSGFGGNGFDDLPGGLNVIDDAIIHGEWPKQVSCSS
jgi:hypothetical protein